MQVVDRQQLKYRRLSFRHRTCQNIGANQLSNGATEFESPAIRLRLLESFRLGSA